MSAKDQAAELFNAGKYAEAIPLYRGIVESDPADLNAWQCLVMSQRNTQAYAPGVETAKAALKVHARSAWLWREMGQMLIKQDRLDEAQKALEQAKRIEPGSEWLWRYLSQLHKARKQPALEAEALEELVELEKASAADLNRLGIIHHDNKNYSRALEFYRASAVLEGWTAPYYNMGLVYNDPEVSQDADAADAYRRALLIDATYQKASVELETTKAKLIPLAEQARSQAKGLVREEERYQHYLNPFEVLQLEVGDDHDDVDPKVIQRAKKRLLQELELNEGRVSWLDDHAVDKSRALTLDDELLDEAKRRYHRTITRNKRLSRFLTHGDIDHFLYADDYFPVDALGLLDEDEGFRTFLSKPFASQYNAVLTRAMDKRAMAVVEVLFDGRRWVADADLDRCLGGAFKKVTHLLEVIEGLEKESGIRFVGHAEVQNALNVHGIVGLFNLLPVQFRAQQTQVVACLRSLAINCHNKHGRTEESKNILQLCKKFQFKSHALNERLKEDYAKIEELLWEQASRSAAPNPLHPLNLGSAMRPVVKGSSTPPAKSDTCFFCGRNKATSSSELRQLAYREISRSHFPRSVQYSRAEIGIERCESCKSVHEKASMLFWIPAVLVVGLCVLLSFAEDGFLVAAIVLAIAFAIFKSSILTSVSRNNGTRPATKDTISQHPILKAGIAQGWSLHKPSA